jgi:hypothetical protein
MHSAGMKEPAFAIVLALTISLFLILMIFIETGRRVGRRHLARENVTSFQGMGAIEGAIFGLMGLLLAFEFSGTQTRFEAHRELIVREANAIGAAYLRISLLPESAQPALRESFRQYLDARLAYYRWLTADPAAAEAAMERFQALQRVIWNQAIAAEKQLGARANADAATFLFMQSLNDMIDITTSRLSALRMHPPFLILGLFFALVIACSLLAGYASSVRRTRSWMHILGFAGMMTVTIVMVLDYEFPRFGLIRIDPVDQVLVDLRKEMN